MNRVIMYRYLLNSDLTKVVVKNTCFSKYINDGISQTPKF